MSFLISVQEKLGALRRPGPGQLKQAVLDLNADLEYLRPYLGLPGIYPYGRKPVFSNGEVEMIVMNWAADRECAPHDHGRSFGWIQVISGRVSHRLFTLDQDDIPVPFAERVEDTGTMMFAPRGAVHSMGNLDGTETVTLHVYTPAITGMKVYDLEKCAACVVADDCGAWWPEDQRQRLQEIRLGRRELGMVEA